MPKNKRLASGLLAVPLVTILLIAGCSVGSPEPTEAPNPSPSISAPADPSATPAPPTEEEPPAPPAPSIEVGQPVDATVADQLNTDSKSQFKGYAMPDGSYIVVDRKAPLPEPVQQDVNARGEAVTQQFPRVEDATSGGAGSARSALTAEIGRQTGKQVILVTRMNGYDYDGNPVTTYWTTGAYRTPQTNTPRSRDEVIALIDAFLANTDASNYVVAWAN